MARDLEMKGQLVEKGLELENGGGPTQSDLIEKASPSEAWF